MGETYRPTAPDRLLPVMLGVFLGGGMLNAMEALLVPRLVLTLKLGYAQALSIQLAYYASYLGFAYPAAGLTARLGAIRATAAGTATIAAGTATLAAGLAARSFAVMLAALLVTSLGVTVLQIACNGAMATLGDRGRAASRFTALQGFNSLGTVVAPVAGAGFLLGGGGAVAAVPFLAFAAGFGALAVACFRVRHLVADVGTAAPRAALLAALLRRPAVAGGTIAIFAYVGAEVTIGSLAPSYLMLAGRGGVAPVTAGRLVGLYWLGAMVGRFAGAWLLRRLTATALLSAAATLAIALSGLAVLPTGLAGAAALLAVGLANSIMFPTIFALAMPADARDVPGASMLLCMAVVGGALVPVAAGLIADRATLPAALLLPLLCYAAILRFARGAAGSVAA